MDALRHRLAKAGPLTPHQLIDVYEQTIGTLEERIAYLSHRITGGGNAAHYTKTSIADAKGNLLDHLLTIDAGKPSRDFFVLNGEIDGLRADVRMLNERILKLIEKTKIANPEGI